MPQRERRSAARRGARGADGVDAKRAGVEFRRRVGPRERAEGGEQGKGNEGPHEGLLERQRSGCRRTNRAKAGVGRKTPVDGGSGRGSKGVPLLPTSLAASSSPAATGRGPS